MKLWMKSQEGHILISPNDIELCSEEIGTIICNFKNDDDYFVLGRYETNERAIEIINDIHQRLIDLQILEIAPDSYRILKNIDCVYQMPEE